MYLMNGRLKEGKFTTIKSSVVDYCISSVEFLKHVIDFSVLDFSKLYSDIHIPLLCETGVNTQIQNVFNSVDTDSIEKSIIGLSCTKTKPWVAEKSVTFLKKTLICTTLREFYPL